MAYRYLISLWVLVTKNQLDVTNNESKFNGKITKKKIYAELQNKFKKCEEYSSEERHIKFLNSYIIYYTILIDLYR